jgi:hypothetical protein
VTCHVDVIDDTIYNLKSASQKKFETLFKWWLARFGMVEFYGTQHVVIKCNVNWIFPHACFKRFYGYKVVHGAKTVPVKSVHVCGLFQILSLSLVKKKNKHFNEKIVYKLNEHIKMHKHTRGFIEVHFHCDYFHWNLNTLLYDFVFQINGTRINETIWRKNKITF